MSQITFPNEEAARDFQRAALTLIRKAFEHATVELSPPETFALCWFLDAITSMIPE